MSAEWGFMLDLNSKLPGAGTTIFTVMSRMAEDCGAINLAQGFPDFDGPQALRDRVSYHLEHGHNQYAKNRLCRARQDTFTLRPYH